MLRPAINQSTVDLVKRFEGRRLTAYRCPAGKWTIGYGLTTGALPGVVVQEGMTISEREAEDYLRRTLSRFADEIWPGFRRQPNANQFGAMLSLAYNIGTGAFLRSTALTRFNAGDIDGAAEAMTWWNKANGKVLRGLVRRREAEVDLFLEEVPGPESYRATPDSEPTFNPLAILGAALRVAVLRLFHGKGG